MEIKAYEFGDDKYLVEIGNDTYAIPVDGTEVKMSAAMPGLCAQIFKRVGEEECPAPVVRCIAGLAYFRHKAGTEDRAFWRETLTIPGGKASNHSKLELVS
jgi:hypothetical protein